MAKQKKVVVILESDPAKIGKDCSNCQKCQLYQDCVPPPFQSTWVHPEYGRCTTWAILLPQPWPDTNPVYALIKKNLNYFKIAPVTGYVFRCGYGYDKSPTIHKARLCYPFLKTDILRYHPDKVLIYGEDVLKAVVNSKEALTPYRLKAFDSQDWFGYNGGSCFVLPEFDVNDRGRYDGTYYQFQQDLKWAVHFDKYEDRP